MYFSSSSKYGRRSKPVSRLDRDHLGIWDHALVPRPRSFLTISTERAKKLTNMDERTMQKIVQELEDDAEPTTSSKDTQKARNRVKARLAQERKAEARKLGQQKKKGGAKEDDDIDEDDLMTFAKKTTKKQK